MTTGESIALGIGAVAVVGGGLYLLTRKPVAPSKATAVGRAIAPVVGTGITALFTGLGAGLVNVFKGSDPSTPTTAAIANQPIPDDSASVQSWNATSSSTFDQLATEDSQAGFEGPF